MADIFDTIGAGPSGDIFDQVDISPGIISEGVKGVKAGWADLHESLGTGIEYLGAKTGVQGFTESGKESAQYWSNRAAGLEPHESIQGTLYKKPELLLDPKWWTYNVARTGVSMLPVIATALAAGPVLATLGASARAVGIGRAIVGGLTGGALEGTGTYRTSIERGDSPEEASRNAEMMLGASAFLNAYGVGKILGTKGKIGQRFVKGAIPEAITEYLEEPVEAQILGEDIVQALKDGLNVVPIAGLLGGGTAALVGARDTLDRNIKEQEAQLALPRGAIVTPPGVSEKALDGLQELKLARSRIDEALQSGVLEKMREQLDASHFADQAKKDLTDAAEKLGVGVPQIRGLSINELAQAAEQLKMGEPVSPMVEVGTREKAAVAPIEIPVEAPAVIATTEAIVSKIATGDKTAIKEVRELLKITTPDVVEEQLIEPSITAANRTKEGGIVPEVRELLGKVEDAIDKARSGKPSILAPDVTLEPEAPVVRTTQVEWIDDTPVEAKMNITPTDEQIQAEATSVVIPNAPEDIVPVSIAATDNVEVAAAVEAVKRARKGQFVNLSDRDKKLVSKVAKDKDFRKLMEDEEAKQSSELPFLNRFDNEALEVVYDEDTNSEVGVDKEGEEFFSGIPLHKLMDYLKPLIDASISTTRLAKSDIGEVGRKLIRTPHWSPVYQGIVNHWHHWIERAPHEVQFNAREKMMRFLDPSSDLPQESKDRIADVVWEGDATNKVLTRDELLGKGLNDDEISEYINIRDALDSLHEWAVEEYQAWRGRNISTAEVMEAAGLNKESFEKLSLSAREVLEETVVANEAAAWGNQNKIVGFAPRYRFGRFVTYATDADGKVVLSEGYDRKEDAQKRMDEYGKDGLSPRMIDVKSHVSEGRELMSIASYLPSINKAMKKAGIEDIEVDKVVALITKNFIGGKLTKRRDVPGYSKDLRKSLMEYTGSFPTAMAKRFHADEFGELISDLKPNERQYARDLVDYMYGRAWQEGSANIFVRSALYTFYLGLKPAFAVLNWTQRVTMTAPWTVNELQERAGLNAVEASKRGWRYIADAQIIENKLNVALINDFIKPKGQRRGLSTIIRDADYLSQDAKTTITKLIREGELKERRILEIGGGSELMSRINFFGFVSERSNRLHAAIVGTKLYADLGMKGTGYEALVDDFVNRTQILYSKANRPEIGRGVLAPAFIFKSFMFNFLNMYHHMYTGGQKGNKAGFSTGVAVMLALGGLAALPLWPGELEGLVDYFMREVAKDPDWPITKRQMAARMNEKGGKYILHGLPSLIGINASPMVGFPDFLSMAIAPIIKGAINLPENLFREDMTIIEKFNAFIPSEPKKLYTAYELWRYGGPRDRFGKPTITQKDILSLPKEIRRASYEIYKNTPKEFGPMEKVAIALGFPTIELNKYYSDVFAIKQAKNNISQLKGELHRAAAKAIISGDRERLDELIVLARKRGVSLNTKSIVGHLVDFDEARR